MPPKKSAASGRSATSKSTKPAKASQKNSIGNDEDDNEETAAPKAKAASGKKSKKNSAGNDEDDHEETAAPKAKVTSGKKTKKNVDETVAVPEPEPPMELKRKASSNPKGVRIVHAVRLENNGALLAGYLGFQHTGQLKEFFADPRVDKLLKTWDESRTANYGCDYAVVKQQGIVTIDRVFDISTLPAPAKMPPKKSAASGRSATSKSTKPAKASQKNSIGNDEDDNEETAAPKAKVTSGKKTKKNVDETVAVPEPEPPMELKRKASSNPKGVRIVHAVRLENNGALLAGYLGFQHTGQLKEFFADPRVDKLLKTWDESRTANYGCDYAVVKQQGIVTIDRVFDIVRLSTQKKPVTAEFLEQTTLPFTGKSFEEDFMQSNDPCRAVVANLIPMFTLMRLHPECFPKATDDDVDGANGFIGGYTAESWSRALWAVRHWRKSKQKSKDDDEKGTSKAQRKQALLPYLLTDAEAAGRFSDEGQAAMLTMVNNPDMLAEEAEDQEELDAAAAEEQEKAEALQDLGSIDLSFLDNLRVSGNPIPDEVLPRLPERTIETFLLSMGAKAKKQLLWPPPEHEAHSFNHTDEIAVARHQASATVEQTKHPEKDDEMLETEAFWELQRAINSVSSEAPDFAEACSLLQFNPKVPNEWKVGFRHLKDYQVPAVAWALIMLTSGGGCGIIGDDVGLGKTAEAVCTMVLLPTVGERLTKSAPKDNRTIRQEEAQALLPQREEQALKEDLPDTLVDDFTRLQPVNTLTLEHLRVQARRYKPTLLVIPSVALQGWRAEMGLQSSLVARLWMGDKARSDWTDLKELVDGNAADLRAAVDALDANDPNTQRHIFITTYQTLRLRSLQHATVGRTPKRSRRRPAQPSDSDSEDGDDEDGGRLSEEQIRNMRSLLQGLFGLVVLDEAHMAKNARSRTNLAIRRLNAEKILCLTATPTPNRLYDLKGPLTLFWECLKRSFPSNPPSSETDSNFDAGSDEESEHDEIVDLDKYEKMTGMLTKVNMGHSLRPFQQFLNPSAYGRIIGSASITSSSIQVMVRPILSAIMLRRVKGQVFKRQNQSTIIAGTVPPFKVTVRELRMNAEQAALYLAAHRSLVDKLEDKDKKKARQDDDKASGVLNMHAHRFLCHAVFDPVLDAYRKNPKEITAAKLATYTSKDDAGYSLYHRITRPRPGYPPHDSRILRAKLMASSSVKLQDLCGIIQNVCYEGGHKLMVFAVWPAVLTEIEMFLTTLGIPFYSIRAAFSQPQRQSALAKFNDPADEVKILLCSSRTASTSFNAQAACHHLAILELDWSLATIDQIIGRLWRVGQSKIVDVYILVVDFTYDQVLQARATKKALAQLASQARIKEKPDDDDNEEDENEDETADDKAEAEDSTENAKVNQCIEYYTRLYGFRSPRHEWDNARDLAAKDNLETEKGFCMKGRPNILTRYRPQLPLSGLSNSFATPEYGNKQATLDRFVSKKTTAASATENEKSHDTTEATLADDPILDDDNNPGPATTFSAPPPRPAQPAKKLPAKKQPGESRFIAQYAKEKEEKEKEEKAKKESSKPSGPRKTSGRQGKKGRDNDGNPSQESDADEPSPLRRSSRGKASSQESLVSTAPAKRKRQHEDFGADAPDSPRPKRQRGKPAATDAKKTSAKASVDDDAKKKANRDRAVKSANTRKANKAKEKEEAEKSLPQPPTPSDITATEVERMDAELNSISD
ncbi:helicase [Diplodia corticola]|uniref:Helicase n=1 Tax=Diplodia corticola TaxID=236234 RepID=A0A1J9RC22_9PEZI|nr:helicase [Diplodia corticola]OJD30027.1 helicase [Diplodia corticola]